MALVSRPSTTRNNPLSDPQAARITSVGFDRFTDPNGAIVSSRLGDSVAVGRVTLFSELSANTAIHDFAKSYSLKGVGGLRLAF